MLNDDHARVLRQIQIWRERLIDLTARNPLLCLNRSRTSKLGEPAPFRDFLLSHVGKHVSLTLVFTDIEDSSRLARMLGNESWGQIVYQHFEMGQKLIRPATGCFIKPDGDAVIAAFVSASDGLLYAVEFQRALQGFTQSLPPSQRFRVRMGLDHGEVEVVMIAGHLDLQGNVVNRAARITGRAAGGEILVSDPVRRAIDEHKPAWSTGVSWEDVDSVEMKGVPPTIVVKATWPSYHKLIELPFVATWEDLSGVDAMLQFIDGNRNWAGAKESRVLLRRLDDFVLLLDKLKDMRAFDEAAAAFQTVQHPLFQVGRLDYRICYASWLAGRPKYHEAFSTTILESMLEGVGQIVLRKGDVRGGERLLKRIQLPFSQPQTKAQKRLKVQYARYEALLLDIERAEPIRVSEKYEEAVQWARDSGWEAMEISCGLGLVGARARTKRFELSDLEDELLRLIGLASLKAYDRREAYTYLEGVRLFRNFGERQPDFKEEGKAKRRQWLDRAQNVIESAGLEEWALLGRLNLEYALLFGEEGGEAQTQAGEYLHRAIFHVEGKVGLVDAQRLHRAAGGPEAYWHELAIVVDHLPD